MVVTRMVNLPLCLCWALSGWPPISFTLHQIGFSRKNHDVAGHCLCGRKGTLWIKIDGADVKKRPGVSLFTTVRAL
ncbi:hypothetical protein KUV65_07810 [Maritalea mobilis]|uniref:hypothetical protein n=1 Tax=Maritalea mobilis TaxID=483324 RepID=UPI001C9507CA|nr:hypothetical protein [Maritalea mobilis]MBY6201261.1 hypothetical protein [Maritalea mobilis]